MGIFLGGVFWRVFFRVFFVYKRGVRLLVLFGKQQKHGSCKREDDVEDEHRQARQLLN